MAVWLFKVSTWQPSLNATVKRWGGVKLLRNQPVNEVWTQTQQRKRGGVLRKRRSGGRLLLSVSGTVTRSFRSTFSSNWGKITFFRQNKSIFFNSIPGLWCIAFNWFKRSELFWVLAEIKSFTMLNTRIVLLFSNSDLIYQIRYLYGSVIFTFLFTNAINQHIVPDNNLGFIF